MAETATDVLDIHLLPKYPLSFVQSSIWHPSEERDRSPITSIRFPWHPVHNISFAYHLVGIDVDSLERAVREVVRRHETLRTIYPVIDGQPMQVVLPEDTPMYFARAQTRPTDIDSREVEELISREANYSFELTREPGIRAALISLDSDSHILQLTMHHIGFDGWSITVLLQEISVLYVSFLTEDRPALPALAAQYHEFTRWEREHYEHHLAYWCRQLSHAPRQPVKLLSSSSRTPGRATREAVKELFRIERDVVDRMQAVTMEERSTPFMAITALLAIFIHRLTGLDDMIIGSPAANRMDPRFLRLIGCFANTLPLRVKVNRGSTLRGVLRHVREVALEGYKHQGAPFWLLVQELRGRQEDRRGAPAGEGGAEPPKFWVCSRLFSVMLDFTAGGGHDFRLGDSSVVGLPVTRREFTDMELKVRMRLTTEGSLLGEFVFGDGQGCEDEATQLVDEFRRLFVELVTHPDRPETALES